MIAPKSPGPLLRALRLSRRLTQEELAQRAEVSTRHLSCLESGRARPSQTMVLLLGSALDLPLRDRNMLLISAGFAPVYRVSALDDPAMVHIHQAVNHILNLHEPHPSLLLDRLWNVVQLNGGAQRLFSWCGLNLEGPINAYRALLDPAFGLRPLIVNFDAVAEMMLTRLRTEADVDDELRALFEDVQQFRGAPLGRRGPVNPIALPIHIKKDGVELRYFTTLTTLGTAFDVTAQELRIEGYFPMDAQTEAFGRQLV